MILKSFRYILNKDLKYYYNYITVSGKMAPTELDQTSV